MATENHPIRSRCQAHGLHYDPARHDGCVLCRSQASVASARDVPEHVANFHGPAGAAYGDAAGPSATPYGSGGSAYGDAAGPGAPPHDHHSGAPGAPVDSPLPPRPEFSNPYAPPADASPFAFGASHGGVLATRGSRLAARLLDGLLAMGAIVIAIPVALIGLPLGLEEGAVSASAVALAGLGMLALFVYQWMLIVRDGQTLGKRWMAIRIVRQDGMPLTFATGVLLRNWVLTACSQVIPFIGLIDALLIFGREQRCLHDIIARTDVIQVF